MRLSATNLKETKCILRWPLILRFDYGEVGKDPFAKGENQCPDADSSLPDARDYRILAVWLIPAINVLQPREIDNDSSSAWGRLCIHDVILFSASLHLMVDRVPGPTPTESDSVSESSRIH
jgi:hypothetical protein